MKGFIIAFSFFISASVFSQSISNTLGIGGVFVIKDASTDFMTLTQTSGQVSILNTLRLENTTSAAQGVLFKGTNRFMHNYGMQNTFLGVNSGNFTSTSAFNTGIGQFSLMSLTSGYDNTAVGNNSLRFNTTGIHNTAVGNTSLNFNTTGGNNTALGYATLYSNTTGNNNTAVGINALFTSTTANSNTALGFQTLFTNTTGSSNSAVGHLSLYENTTGNSNTSVGRNSLYANSTGNSNTALGYNSLDSNISGDSNTALGYQSGSGITTGNNNTTIGNRSQVPNGTLSNQVQIGNDAVTYAGIQVAWSITSDRKWKSNILNSNLGLDFINKLNPVSYTRKNDISQKTEYGFIAQEVEEVLKESEVENTGMISIVDNGNYEMRYNDLFAPMVKAIQELKAENEELKKNNEDLVSEVELLKSTNDRIVKLEKMMNEMSSLKQTSLDKKEEVNLTNNKQEGE